MHNKTLTCTTGTQIVKIDKVVDAVQRYKEMELETPLSLRLLHTHIASTTEPISIVLISKCSLQCAHRTPNLRLRPQMEHKVRVFKYKYYNFLKM